MNKTIIAILALFAIASAQQFAGQYAQAPISTLSVNHTLSCWPTNVYVYQSQLDNEQYGFYFEFASACNVWNPSVENILTEVGWTRDGDTEATNGYTYQVISGLDVNLDLDAEFAVQTSNNNVYLIFSYEDATTGYTSTMAFTQTKAAGSQTNAYPSSIFQSFIADSNATNVWGGSNYSQCCVPSSVNVTQNANGDYDLYVNFAGVNLNLSTCQDWSPSTLSNPFTVSIEDLEYTLDVLAGDQVQQTWVATETDLTNVAITFAQNLTMNGPTTPVVLNLGLTAPSHMITQCSVYYSIGVPSSTPTNGGNSTGTTPTNGGNSTGNSTNSAGTLMYSAVAGALLAYIAL